MARYDYSCDCGETMEVIAPMSASGAKVFCECGELMQKCITLPSTDLVNNVRFSSSMGVNPRRILEMEKKYPGSRYTPDGKLIINSRKDKLNKMAERNLIEFE